MKKIFTIIIILLLATFPVLATPELKGYNEFDIPTGTFIPVISLQEISTAYNDETDTLHFISTNDIFMFEHLVLPKGSKLIGSIEKKNEPIRGTHASMKIFINKMYMPDGFELPLKGYLYTSNNNVFGGGMTDPESYVKRPHYVRAIGHHFMGAGQYRPGPVRKMGEHFSIASGTDLLVVLVAPLHMTHLPTSD